MAVGAEVAVEVVLEAVEVISVPEDVVEEDVVEDVVVPPEDELGFTWLLRLSYCNIQE